MGDMHITKDADKTELPRAIAASVQAVDSVLERVLPQPHGAQARVQEAMRYAIFAGGKRIRPFLVLHSARLFAVDDAHALRVGAAIEALHTYSLVHDDLPCMDDDDLRRGRPTTHIAFDEMTAVLAGDALLTLQRFSAGIYLLLDQELGGADVGAAEVQGTVGRIAVAARPAGFLVIAFQGAG